MPQLKKGFSYLYFLFLVVITATLIGGISRVLINERKSADADLKKLQAHYYARSAINYYQSNSLLLTNSNERNLTVGKLFALPGPEQTLQYGGFKIIQNNDTIFFLGYTGTATTARTASEVLVFKEGIYGKWQP